VTRWRVACAAWLALALVACATPRPPDTAPPGDFPTKGFPTGPEVRDSVYLPADRSTPPPAGYGLYSVLLARSADRNTVRVLSELFRISSGAGEAALARENLNLITIPVKSTAEAARVLVAARQQPEATAAALMQRSYDFGQAALLMASVCHPTRGAAVVKACGSQAPDGPLLVTALRPLDAAPVPGQALLIVNLSTTPPEAVREVMAAYRRQILRRDFPDRAELSGWRLWALNHVLDAAQLLPGLSKAYAASK
jgi:hypothetical protein